MPWQTWFDDAALLQGREEDVAEEVGEVDGVEPGEAE